MTDQWTLEQLKEEAVRYGMTVDPNLSLYELDRAVQAKVAADFRRGICSACGKPLHASDC